tara:strand:- start:275 stop:595 length:321 start_codon:yes stop_codon:yes gene_type:complete
MFGEDKETPVYVIRTFRCPNCESRNLKWEKWGNDPDQKIKIWQDIQYSCCADCHKTIPSKLAYDQYSYQPFKERKRLYEEKIKNSDYEPNWDEVFNNKILKPLNEK